MIRWLVGRGSARGDTAQTGAACHWNRFILKEIRAQTHLNPDRGIFLILDLGFLNGTFRLIDLAQSTKGCGG